VSQRVLLSLGYSACALLALLLFGSLFAPSSVLAPHPLGAAHFVALILFSALWLAFWFAAIADHLLRQEARPVGLVTAGLVLLGPIAAVAYFLLVVVRRVTGLSSTTQP
jgi:hypothetical protein